MQKFAFAVDEREKGGNMQKSILRFWSVLAELNELEHTVLWGKRKVLRRSLGVYSNRVRYRETSECASSIRRRYRE